MRDNHPAWRHDEQGHRDESLADAVPQVQACGGQGVKRGNLHPEQHQIGKHGDRRRLRHWRPARSGLRVGGNRVSGAQAPEPDDPGGDSRTRGMAVGGTPFGGFPATEPGLSTGSRSLASIYARERDKFACFRSGKIRMIIVYRPPQCTSVSIRTTSPT